MCLPILCYPYAHATNSNCLTFCLRVAAAGEQGTTDSGGDGCELCEIVRFAGGAKQRANQAEAGRREGVCLCHALSVRPCSRNKNTNPDIKTLIKYQAGLRQLYNFTN